MDCWADRPSTQPTCTLVRAATSCDRRSLTELSGASTSACRFDANVCVFPFRRLAIRVWLSCILPRLGSALSQIPSTHPVQSRPVAFSSVSPLRSSMSDDSLSASQLREQYARGGTLDDSQLTASQLRARHNIQANSQGRQHTRTLSIAHLLVCMGW